MADLNSIKLCECGCGRPTNIAKQDDKRKGHVAGMPNRFLSGHSAIKHGRSRSSTYRTWAAMKTRCTNPKGKNFAQYGGRGIKVCDRWINSFECFFADMGERPARKTLDRIDYNGNYEPGNCRWATHSEQVNNSSHNHLITAFGKTLTVTQWAAHLGITRGALSQRLSRKWPIERALKR
jgi:hypothetical protein